MLFVVVTNTSKSGRVVVALTNVFTYQPTTCFGPDRGHQMILEETHK
jgi:hypothetical protein